MKRWFLEVVLILLALQSVPVSASSITDELARCVVFLRQDISAGSPTHVGSGFLVTKNDDVYLVTAAHVARDIGPEWALIVEWGSGKIGTTHMKQSAWTDEGWLYLMKQLAIPLSWQTTPAKWLVKAIVLDLFNREVVGWSLKPRMTAGIVTDALTMAWFRRKPVAGLIHHSGRGSQYASEVFQAKLREYGMACSMSRKGNCRELALSRHLGEAQSSHNAPTESWFGSFKNERVYGECFETHDEMKAMTFEYIEVFYNRKRRHSTLDYKSPKQHLDDWFIVQQQEKLVA